MELSGFRHLQSLPFSKTSFKEGKQVEGSPQKIFSIECLLRSGQAHGRRSHIRGISPRRVINKERKKVGPKKKETKRKGEETGTFEGSHLFPSILNCNYLNYCEKSCSKKVKPNNIYIKKIAVPDLEDPNHSFPFHKSVLCHHLFY